MVDALTMMRQPKNKMERSEYSRGSADWVHFKQVQDENNGSLSAHEY